MSSIISKTELAAYMNKSLTDAVAKQVVDAVNAYVERITHRCWGDTVTITETHNGFTQPLWLRHQDVVHISKVTYLYPGTADTDYTVDEYHWDELGRLALYYRGSYRSTLGRVKVTYTYGVEDVPEDLKLAALGIAAGFYNWAVGGQKEISATQVGSYRVEYAGNRRAADVIDTTSQSNFAIISSYATKRA